MQNLLKEVVTYQANTQAVEDLIKQIIVTLCERQGYDIDTFDFMLKVENDFNQIKVTYGIDKCTDDVEFIAIPKSRDDVEKFLFNIRELASSIFDCM